MEPIIQLDLFVEEDEMSLLRKELKAFCQQQERLKRTLSSRHQELSRMCLQLKEENEELRQRIERLEKAQTPKPSHEDDLLERLFKEAYNLKK